MVAVVVRMAYCYCPDSFSDPVKYVIEKSKPFPMELTNSTCMFWVG